MLDSADAPIATCHYLACDDHTAVFWDDVDNIDAWGSRAHSPDRSTGPLLEEADVLLSQTASHPGPEVACPGAPLSA